MAGVTAIDQRINNKLYTARDDVITGSIVVPGSLLDSMCVMAARGIVQFARAPIVPTVLTQESERKKLPDDEEEEEEEEPPLPPLLLPPPLPVLLLPSLAVALPVVFECVAFVGLK